MKNTKRKKAFLDEKEELMYRIKHKGKCIAIIAFDDDILQRNKIFIKYGVYYFDNKYYLIRNEDDLGVYEIKSFKDKIELLEHLKEYKEAIEKELIKYQLKYREEDKEKIIRIVDNFINDIK